MYEVINVGEHELWNASVQVCFALSAIRFSVRVSVPDGTRVGTRRIMMKPMCMERGLRFFIFMDLLLKRGGFRVLQLGRD